MKTKAWMTTLLSAAAMTLSLTATTVFAGQQYAVGKSRPAEGIYDYAKVVSAEPVVRYVTVTTPVKECWEETRQYTTVARRPSNAIGTIFGAIIGGVIGHQIGNGHHNDAATVAGTLIGAAMGSSAGQDNAGYESTTHSRPVQRCETKSRQHEEERIDGYRVIYQYHGQKYATQMPYDPGDRIRIRVDVRPAVE